MCLCVRMLSQLFCGKLRRACVSFHAVLNLDISGLSNSQYSSPFLFFFLSVSIMRQPINVSHEEEVGLFLICSF